MNGPGSVRYSIDEVLDAARARLDRVQPETLEHERANGALIIDIRPIEQRNRDGELHAAILVDRNILEWRLDPASCHHIAEIIGSETPIVVVCNEGYSSSLAAAQLQDLGLHRATDLIGGYQAWLAWTRRHDEPATLTNPAPVPSTRSRPGWSSPDFGQIDTCHGGKRFLLRGSAAAEAELAFMAACHNIQKLVGFTDNASRATR